MYVTKCDACGNEIETKKERFVYFGYKRSLASKALCEKCAAPIVAILEEKGLIENENRA